MNSVFREFAQCMKNENKPDSESAQSLVDELKACITKNFYQCTNEILFSLSQMYVGDERFKNNIDNHADGTADFVSKAIEIYCKK